MKITKVRGKVVYVPEKGNVLEVYYEGELDRVYYERIALWLISERSKDRSLGNECREL
jgi:hypothetical protein